MTSRVWLWTPWVLFALIVLGWVGYWHIVATQAEGRLRVWASEQNASGAQVEIGGVVRHGFPVLMRLEIRDFSYAPARGGWRATTPALDLNVEMLQPSHVIFAARRPIALSRADGALTNIAARKLIVSVRMRGAALAQAGIEGDDVTLDDPSKEGVLTARKIVANLRPDPRQAGDYQLAFDAADLALPRPVRSFETFGLNVPAMRAAVVVTHASALMQASQNDPLGPWREAGGRVRFEGLALNWGPLETTGTGEGGLDEQHRLQGRLVIPVRRPAPVLNAIAGSERVDQSARRALQLLAAGYLVSGDEITLDVNADDGVMRVEGLPVRMLPPVY
ncbi:DUF2125 domain-containing protein [Terricaulis sp.]|uniref:DUF2125 domain-containing protein n=1 Tax=Terricaulis sp. TaxID=2768686 RepID=UPI003784546A